MGHKSAKMTKRAKSLESRQESAIREKAALLHDVERAEPLKLAPRAFHSARLLELVQPPMERVVDLRLEALDELGDRVEPLTGGMRLGI